MGGQDPPRKFFRRFRLIHLFPAILSGLMIASAILILQADPGVPLLLKEGGAQWIRFPKPFQLMMHDPQSVQTHFRCTFSIGEIPEKAILTFRVMKQAAVYLDGRLLLRTPDEPLTWKQEHLLDLSPWLARGSRELRIDVTHVNGNPALLALCPALAIFTNDRWEASTDGSRWLPAVPVDRIEPFPISRTFPRTDHAFRSLLPFFGPLFLLAFLWDLYLKSRIPEGRLKEALLSASTVRWLILAAWLVMAIVNFRKLPLSMGMDYAGHATYIYYVAQYWRIPLASEGWQMFQPPLFYFLEALFFRLFLLLFDTETVVRILKLLPLICGLVQVQICYLALRTTFPGRELPQVIGILLAGLLPMNLYMSQSLGNEPLAGCLTALVVYGVCRLFSEDLQSLDKMAIYMGFTLGLALLTKVTPFLLLPPVLFFLSIEIMKRGEAAGGGGPAVVRFTFLLTGMVLAVAGWYYLRNWTETGRIFIGGWDLYRGIAWWQDPGYRTARQCYGFGESLFYPVYASIYGYWDALYSSLWADGFLSEIDRPPWNYRFMLSGIWLSLLPSTAVFAGAMVSLKKGHDACRQILRFCVVCILIYLAAIFYLFLSVPILSSAKATYAMGLTPCLAILAAAGFEIMASRRFVRAVLCALMACWAAASYASYLAI